MVVSGTYQFGTKTIDVIYNKLICKQECFLALQLCIVHSKRFPQGTCMNTSENLQCQPMLWQTTNIWTHLTYKFMSCFLLHLSYCTQYQFEYIIKLAMSSASVLTNNKEAVIEKTSTSVDNLAQFTQNRILYGGGLGHNCTFWDPVQN